MDQQEQTTRSRCRAGWVVALIVAATALPMIWFGGVLGRAGMDQLDFHEPAVRIFAYDWPDLEFGNYLSATTPGYHVLLAAVARAGLSSREWLQSVGMLFGVGLGWVLGTWFGGISRSWLWGLLGAMVVLSSRYVYSASVWMLPDNAGWLGVALALWLSLDARDTWRWRWSAAAAVLLIVACRQVHAWVSFPLVVAAWLSVEGRLSDRVRAVLKLTLACAPAMALLAWFVWMWKGVTPPLFQAQYAPIGSTVLGMNPAAPILVLAVLGMFGVFVLPALWPDVREAWRRRRAVCVTTLAIALVLGIVPATTASLSLGRISGIWNIATKGPTLFGHTSVAMVAVGLLGMLVLVGLVRRLGRGRGLVIVATILGFTLALGASFHLWQRYVEPLVLMVLVLGVVRGASRSSRATEPSAMPGFRPSLPGMLGMLVILAFNLVGTGLMIRSSEPVERQPIDHLLEAYFGRATPAQIPRMIPGPRPVQRHPDTDRE